MKHRRSSVGRTRLILILLCIVLAAAMLWCALSLILRVGTYSGRTVGKDPVQEQTPVEPVDLEPTVPENSYDPAGFYEEGGFKHYKSEDTLASVGVDVSSHQQEIDWELVAANGVEFAMIRVGYRGYTEGEIQPDDYFVQNIEGARAAGLDVGVYFFSQALDEQEAIDEANYVLEQIKDYPLSYPVIFDWEDIQADARTDGMDSVQLTKTPSPSATRSNRPATARACISTSASAMRSLTSRACRTTYSGSPNTTTRRAFRSISRSGSTATTAASTASRQTWI